MTTGNDEDMTELDDKVAVEDAREALGVAEAHAWAEPIPTVKGWVSTREKSMNFNVEARKLPSWN